MQITAHRAFYNFASDTYGVVKMGCRRWYPCVVATTQCCTVAVGSSIFATPTLGRKGPHENRSGGGAGAVSGLKI
jgi:hypothetical protein